MNKAEQMKDVENPQLQSQKTGTLKPPAKPNTRMDFFYADKRGKELCTETRQDVVVYHDERGSLSQRTVRDSKTMKLPIFVLAVYRFERNKVVEKLGIIARLIRGGRR
jgi:hypothetical protein